MKKVKFLLLIIVWTVMLVVTAAEAAVSVTPDRHILLLKPGETRIVEYKVHNTGPGDLEINFDIQNWTRTKAARKITIESWIKIDTDKLKIKANEAKSFSVSVRAPQGIEGEMLAMIFLCYKEDKESLLNIRNGTPLYLVIAGTEVYKAEIEDLGIEYIEDEYMDKLNFALKVANKGNIHINPDICISVKDAKAKEVKNFLSMESKILLPGEAHIYHFGWTDPMISDGDYTVLSRVSYKDKMKDVEAVRNVNVKNGKIAVIQDKMEK